MKLNIITRYEIDDLSGELHTIAANTVATRSSEVLAAMVIHEEKVGSIERKIKDILIKHNE